ncbi:ABC1 kinase family protein [Aureimonas psammosilenae]|uniref:ABC1 kinase family protein n=1 Tax=Aureimonas psammosilenae TaxID=2495496 RepID=UPI001261146B|nr:AarF/ABC1/UbiB kinase family protein [Aureimonas psammosilenae]
MLLLAYEERHVPSRPPFPPRGLPVPSGRLSRLARFGGMAGGVAGGVLMEGARRLAQGKRPRLGDLLLTPGNVSKVTNRLAEMRGAAMKVGQLLSMDAGDVLPAELAEILGRLRADAEPMPKAQVQAVLDRQWGRGWEKRFDYFSFRPLAAASIGQVHRAQTTDGRDLAVKVQYPGVRQSIDSDVDNVATLLRIVNIVPPGLDVAPLLAEGKRQLHEEADYEREGRYLRRFGELLVEDPAFIVPAMHDDLTTPDVLAMSFVKSRPIEELGQAPQEERDRIATRLIDLAFRELFRFHLMQTDPNLANYRYEPESGKIVLLDFGATRAFSPELGQLYRRLTEAAIRGDAAGAEAEMTAIGYFDGATAPDIREAVISMFMMGTEGLRTGGIYDFTDTAMLDELRTRAETLAADRAVLPLPPIDALFLQRKFGGLYLLARRLRARVDVGTLIAGLDENAPGGIRR